MRTLGRVTFVVGVVVVLAGLFVGLRSIPDIKRYLRIRAM